MENAMLYWLCLLLVVAALLPERWRLRRDRGKVPVRIHVHGTRGKTGAARALAASLRAQGMRVLAKTTGDRPEYVLPDGSTVPVRRIGPARIQEHVSLMRKAASMGVEAVVAEGMALQPETVFMSERILRANQAVIVNIRPDHAETMGDGREGVLRTLRHMIPRHGDVFTADEDGAGAVREQAARKGASCSVVRAPETGQAPVLARAVTRAVLPGRERLREFGPLPAAAALFPAKIKCCGMPVFCCDFLSANDVVSSRLLLEACPLRADFLCTALVATRADRPLRTRDFMDWILAEPRFEAVAAMGDHAGHALLRGARGRACGRFLRVRPWSSPARLLGVMAEEARARGKKGLTVIALGNVHGYGERWRAAMDGAASSGGGVVRDAQRNKGEGHAD